MDKKFQVNIRPYQWLTLMVILGVLIRLFNLEATGLWMDEIHSTVGTDPDKTIKEVIEYCKMDQPPVFFLFLYGWFKVFPYNDLYGRLFSLLTGALGIISMYFLGKEVKNSRVGLICSFLTMINYFHVDHSRQVRFYPLVFLFSSLSYLFFIRVLKRRRPVDFFLYILATAALLNTHYFGLVVFASQFILFVFIIVWKKIRDGKFIALSLLSGVAVGLSFLHWLPVVLSDLQIPKFHAPPVKWYFLVEYYWVYFKDVVTVMICGGLTFLAIRTMFFKIKSKSLAIDDVVLLGWVGLGFLIPLLYSLLRMPMLEFKYTFIVVPAILLFAALGFDTIEMKKIQLYIIPILFFSFLENAFFIKSIYFVPYPPQQWKEVTQHVIKTDNRSQLVFSQYAWYFRYYFKIYKSAHPPFEPQYVANFDSMILGANSIWILNSTQFFDEGLSVEQKNSLELHFRFVSERKFSDTIAKHYVRR